MTARRPIRAQLGELPPHLDLGATSAQIMRRGRRIRRIRQSLAVSTAALAVVGITTAAALTGHHGSPLVQPAGGGPGLAPASSSPAPVPAASAASAAPSSSSVASSELPAPVASRAAPSLAPSSSASSVVATCTPAPQSTTGAPAAASGGNLNDGNPPPWGSVIDAGTDTSGKALVLYAYPISDPAIPCTHFGLMLGTKDVGTAAPSGVTGMYATNEFDGSDSAPGFHAAGLSGGGNQISKWYALGYYVGAAASVSIPENGTAVAATVVPWSVNPDVKIWWVSGAAAVPSFGVPSAKDAQGNLLPAGTASAPGVG